MPFDHRRSVPTRRTDKMNAMTDRWRTARQLIGSQLGRSSPMTIDQQLVDEHALRTGDAQWIHNDPERARTDGPFGGPIVQGFLLLATLTRHSTQLQFPDLGPLSMTVNYGFDKVRFLRPVPVGAGVWVTATLAEVRPRSDGSAVLGLDVEMFATTDADASADQPVLAARWLFLAVP